MVCCRKISSRVKLLLTVLLVYNFTGTNCQIIRGIILDGETRAPVAYAAVYISGSFIATYSGTDGQFTLDIGSHTLMPLNINALGYYSFTVEEVPVGKKLIVYLRPKIFELDEVLITAKGNIRQIEKNLKLFKSVFIGESYNSMRCDILNEDDLRFQFSRDGDTMFVFSYKPVIIKNRALGYTVTYFIDNFKYCISDKFFYLDGNILFNEDLVRNDSDEKMFEKRRIRTFMGSRMHFLRALYENRLEEEGFRTKDSLKILTYEEATGTIDSTMSADPPKFIKVRNKIDELYIVYFYPKGMSSTMTMKKEFVFFKKNGFFDGSALLWEGAMATQRIGDWLPYEYNPKY